MACVEFGINIPNDKDGKLEKVVKRVADTNSTKATICAGYITTKDFLDYCLNDNAVDNNVESVLDIEHNTLCRLLREYYEEKHHNVINSIAVRNASTLNGFSNDKAKSEALDYTTNLIIKLYYSNISKPKEQRLTRRQIIDNISKKVYDDFVSNIAVPFMKELKAGSNKKAIAEVEKASAINKEYKAFVKQYNESAKIFNSLPAEQIEGKKKLKEEMKAIREQINKKESERYVIFTNIINEFGNTRQKNYTNLVAQIRRNPNEWYNSVFMGSKMVNLVREFEETLESDKLEDVNFADDNDAVNDNAESIDQMSKSWEDKLYKSFDKAVATDLKLYFNSLYRLASPAEWGDTNYNYDTNNELGVPMTMGANYIITQLSNYGNFSSVNDFIKSIYNASQSIPALYGLSQLVNDMIAKPEFANYVFTQLANPKIKKTVATLTENGIDFTQSNKAVEPLTYMVYQMFNSVKDTYRNSFNSEDKARLNKAIIAISKVNDVKAFMDNKQYERYDKFINEMVYKYFPKTDKNVIRKYLYKSGNDIVKNYSDLLKDLRDLVNVTEQIVETYNETLGEYITKNSSYKKRKLISEESGQVFNETAPVLDLSSIEYDKLYLPIINIAKKLVNYSAVKNELNSVNAEGNMASDLIGNNYITNFFKQISFGTIENSEAGLERLKEEITKGHQYDYSPIFFGVKDSAGRTIVEGLFERKSNGEVVINPNAKNLLKVSLFDGAKDRVNAKSAMYSNMSKGDYFLTQLVAFENPIGFDELVGVKKDTLNKKYAGFFMRTPSDAPKNFIVQAPKYSIDGLWKVVNSSRTAYFNKVQKDIASKFNFDLDDKLSDISDDIVLGNIKGKLDNNIVSGNVIYSMFTEEIENQSFNNKYHIYDEATNKVIIPFIYKSKDSTAIVYLQGDKVVGTMNNIAENLEIVGIYSSDGDQMPQDFYIELSPTIEEEGIMNGQIQRLTNRDNSIFRGFRTHLLNELNTYIDQLNNVFEKNKKGEWVTRKDTTGLIDRAHYNKEIVKDGRLTGNFFSFKKLFTSRGYNVDKKMDELLSLYGQVDGSLFKKTRTGLSLNTDRTDIINTKNGRIELVVSKQLNTILDNVVDEWINNFYSEIINRTQQYQTILSENDYSNNTVIEVMFNNAIMEMNFDDIFEGDSKFYKNAQDFLKRAKEVQAAGKAYAGFDLNESLSNPIHNVLDINGQEQTILVNGSEYLLPRRGNGTYKELPMKARNGFRAITIENTVRPSQYAGQIKQELLNILTPKVGKKEAERIATEIASGYFDVTKVNDAQSYITLDEFIARRYADGTLNQYQDILAQIMEVRNGTRKLTDIDLSNINARIQIQKNFYFDKKFDETTRTFYPRQIKNAEFVLIPELIKGTELEQLYNIMRKYDIGQVNTVETSKAAKKNILTFWDNDGNINPNFEQELVANNEAAIEDFYYRYLYKQQEVPEHMKDEHNKAGIQIMKKIIDNASPEVQPHIDEFFNAYCANIREDFNKLINNMGWKVASNGSLVNASNNSSNLDFDDFYKKARVEAQRLGLDSNFIEYLTLEHLGGNPKMPNYMNNVSTKLESIAQAIFNSSVTRQTLPGWHAAQFTGVGHGVKVLGSDGEFRELKYHPEVKDKDGNIIQEAYAEVMIPRWSNLIPKDYPIEKLATEGLDIHIGYRIPTEGKQSVSILKVVGFLDDIYGSSIMVPDEWVTQTGSDFDVDSVYGICYKMYKDNKGVLRKIQFDNDASEEATRRRYINYINKALDERIDKDEIADEFTKNEITELRNELKDISKREKNNDKFKEAINISAGAWDNLPDNPKYRFPAINVNKQYFTKELIIERYDKLIETYEEIANEETDKEIKKAVEEFVDASKLVRNVISLSKENANEYILKSERLKSLYEDNKQHYFNVVQNAALKANLPSYSQFSNWTIYEQNSRAARDNKILDSMVAIMNHPNSREENYSRSNFDDLVKSMKRMNDLRGASSVSRSAYNPLDQIDFMENAISGAQLKAFSVTRDTFNSVNNYVKSTLSSEHTINIKYSAKRYDVNQAVEAYGISTEGGDVIAFDKKGAVLEKNQLKKCEYFVINHKRFANSNNNRNVVGKLLTPYSSQTTAHILDAIKEGAIFNENDYTFGTFKTLIDVGTDYDTAIAFLMQPGITRIVDSYYKTKSIYVNSGVNPIYAAIKSIATNLGITINGDAINEYTPITNVINLLSSNRKLQDAFRELFSVNISYNNTLDNVVFDLDIEMMENRLKQAEITNNLELSSEDKVYRDAAFDLAIIMTFNKIHKTTKNIEALARCSNPDRFGAKQTIRATRRTLENIKVYATDYENSITNTLTVKGKPLISALYPGFGSSRGINVNESAYPYLAAFLKYATIPSVQANTRLFPTESKEYNDITNAVQNKLGIVFTDDQYKEYKQYMMNDVYMGVPFLSTPITVDKEGRITYDNERIKEQTENNTFYWNEEYSRIFGYDITQSGYFEVKNINKPSVDEIARFNKLTPAQKVIWIQANFTDGRGLFDFLDVNTFNQYEYKNKGFTSQSIRFNDQIDNIEEIFRSFKDSFFNKNPLIRLAAIDLIKYSFVVEGFRFKKGSISKLITNDAMYSNLEDMGMNLIDTIRKQFDYYKDPKDAITTKFIDKFVRSHSEIVKEVKIPKAKKSKQGVENIGYKFNSYAQGDNMLFIPFEDRAKDLLELINVINIDSPKEYVRINKYVGVKQRKTTLYKIKKTEQGIYLIPLNILERNEVSDYSANPKNNIYKAVEYYEELIKTSIDNGVSINEILKDGEGYEEIKILRNQFTIKPHKVKHIFESVENPNEIQRILLNGTEKERAEVNKFVTDILDYVQSPIEGRGSYGVVRNDNRYISSLIPGNADVVQNIPVGDSFVTVKISRYTKSNGKSKQFSYILLGDKRADKTALKIEEAKALANSIKAGAKYPNLYRIDIITDSKIKEQVTNADNKRKKEADEELYSITSDINSIDIDIDSINNFTNSDKVAVEVYKEINKRARDLEDSAANKFIRTLTIKGLDILNSGSIHDNRKNIYTSAAEYYSGMSHLLFTNINKFTTINGEEYSIDDPKLYEHLRNHPEDYPILVKLILDAKTFGDAFHDIFNLDLKGEDETTTKAIEKIRDSINEVRNSAKLGRAVELLFNDYIANEFSTNPLIRRGLIELRTTFGDTDWFDLNFSDIGELNHKQVQTVAKYVYSILNEATKIVAPKAVNTFTEQFDRIMNSSGSFNWDNIITEKGKFITPYTEQFLKDRQKVIDDLAIAKETYGEDSIEYVKAKLARDEWRAKNLEQEIVATYYKEDIALRRRVVAEAPNEYVEYMKLIHELYNDSRTTDLLTKEEIERRKEINHKISILLSDVNEDGTLKSDEKQYRAARLRNYISEKRKLNSEYFNYNETEGFKNSLEYYTNIIKQYEKAHPYETLDQRLADRHYKDAYDWIQTNTVYTLDDETKIKIFDAFKTLKDEDNLNADFIKRILKKANAYDEYGNIDPRKLSDEDIANIKEKTQHKYSWTYESDAGEAILIKDVPANLPVLDDKFYRMLRSDEENDKEVNPERLRIIGEINKLLGKVVNEQGRILASDMFEILTDKELEYLGTLYHMLHKIKGGRNNKELRKKFKKNVEFLTNDEAFNEAFAYAQTKLKGTRRFDLWIDIFVQTDKNSNIVTDKEGELVPNNDLFGYIIPKDKTYINQNKTDARNLIQNDLEFIPTEYYYSAMREATAKGKFKEWYEANHVFNPYTHKYEPLKIWTIMRVNPNGNLKGKYSYNPTYENTERTVKEEYKNNNYKEYSTNYNLDTGEYNNFTTLTDKEKEMMQLLQSTINAYASTFGMKKFAADGFLPRRAKYNPDARWYVKQAIGAVGLEWRNTGEHKWSEIVDYVHDHDADFDMMSILKQKGFKEVLEKPRKGTFESEEDFAKRTEDWKKEKEQIEADNLKLDNEILDRDWKSVFQDFIAKATEYNAKQRAKNTVYLLLEDLKDNPAYAVSRWSGNVKENRRTSTNENTSYQTVQQDNTYKLVQNWARRILYKEFKKDSKFTKWADMMQNITSAKYMIFNVTGGIANVGTGMGNIIGEVFAKDYFDKNTFTQANGMYMSNSLSMLADMYSPTTNNFAVGLTKLFDVVDFDAFNERRPNETATEYVKRIRDGLYAMQSGGEHYMQNTVLFAILKSNRLFKDIDGTTRFGSFAEYTWKLEAQTLMGLLNGKEDLLIKYKFFLKDISKDMNELKKYDTFTRDFNEEFLREIDDKQLIEDYIKARKEALKNAKKEFNDDTKHPTAESQFELGKDGYVNIKEGSKMTGQMFGELRQKVIQVNKKIHGVYDKIGAARIESEWWGGLVMQYHKHIYPGIMKRYRTKGYYNELRGSVERGSYVSLANFLSTEFRDISRKSKERANEQNENIALVSIQSVIKASIDTVINAKLNWNLMPEWERRNIKRSLADLFAITGAILSAMCLYAMTDDDDIKESEILATNLYMTDRLLSEAQMYTPWGFITEAKTLWSSPIASFKGPQDLFKGLGLATQWMFSEDFNINYTTGLYKGQNKLKVLLYRNTPIYRVYQRLSTMTKNNSYYRINETALNLKFAKAIADEINPE